jgi:hypothetical protein
VSKAKVNQLLELISPPSAVPLRVNWPAVERTAILVSLCRTIARVSSIHTAKARSTDSFWVLHRTTNNPNLRLKDQIELRQRMLINSDDAPAPASQLICWGLSDHGDACYWLTRGAEAFAGGIAAAGHLTSSRL